MKSAIKLLLKGIALIAMWYSIFFIIEPYVKKLLIYGC